MKNNTYISIITLSKNNNKEFSRTMKSIFSQKNIINMEWLIIDGSDEETQKSKKILIKKITTNNYQASKLDLKYFKNQFEDIMLNEGFLNIFDFKKVKNFILEVS